jgi:dUTP pyrophosphatase
MSVVVRVIRDPGADPDVALPVYETAGAAGADVRANLLAGDRAVGIILQAGARALIPTGLRMAIPSGFEVQLRPRSGLALKQGLTLLNAPGTIDADYRGPVGVILVNLGTDDAVIRHGDRIAQMVVAPVVQGTFTLTDTLDDTARGAGGFGSTGVA